jgi:hypothetical protein
MRSKLPMGRISAREACQLTQVDEGWRRHWKNRGGLLQRGDTCDETDTVELAILRKLLEFANPKAGSEIWAQIGPEALDSLGTSDLLVALWDRTEGKSSLICSAAGEVKVICPKDDTVRTIDTAEDLLKELVAADGHDLLVISLAHEIRTAQERFRNRLPGQWRQRSSEAAQQRAEKGPGGGS